jgi:thiol-disulfide isomerase/thioredoxin
MSNRVIEITNFNEHESFIANNKRAVIFFGSIKCGHCRNMVPVVGKMAEQYPTVAFGHIEITEVEVENVDGVPVFVGYKDQIPIDMVLGASPKTLTNMIETKLVTLD